MKKEEYQQSMKSIRVINDIDNICKLNICMKYQLILIEKLIEDWRV